jgi:hypothetical protein
MLISSVGLYTFFVEEDNVLSKEDVVIVWSPMEIKDIVKENIVMLNYSSLTNYEIIENLEINENVEETKEAVIAIFNDSLELINKK